MLSRFKTSPTSIRLFKQALQALANAQAHLKSSYLFFKAKNHHETIIHTINTLKNTKNLYISSKNHEVCQEAREPY